MTENNSDWQAVGNEKSAETMKVEKVEGKGPDIDNKSLDDIIKEETKQRKKGKKRSHPNSQNQHKPIPPNNRLNTLKLINEVCQKLGAKAEFTILGATEDINSGFKHELKVTINGSNDPPMVAQGFGKSKKRSKAVASYNLLSSPELKKYLMKIEPNSRKWKSLQGSGIMEFMAPQGPYGMSPFPMGQMRPGAMHPFYGSPFPGYGGQGALFPPNGAPFGFPPGPFGPYGPYGHGGQGFNYAPQPLFRGGKRRKRNQRKKQENKVQAPEIGEEKEAPVESKPEPTTEA